MCIEFKSLNDSIGVSWWWFYGPGGCGVMEGFLMVFRVGLYAS